MKKYEWAVVGSGIAGIVASEILTREGHSVILVEKNEKLAAETTRDFHEWMHAGSLYTLIPDNLMTLKFILGALDDLLEYYGSYKNMNLIRTEKGLKIDAHDDGWFDDNYIHFKFRLKDRKWALPWLLGVARAIFVIDRIKEHDWLRRRAGMIDPFKLDLSELYGILKKLLSHNETFYDYETPDFTINSRKLLTDILKKSIGDGLQISNANEFLNYERKGKKIILNCSKECFEVDNMVLCISGNITKCVDSSIKVSYAPMAVVKNLYPSSNSFVELDFFPKNCINMITKRDGVGLVGGISLSDHEKCESYINEVLDKHRRYNPNLEVLHKYVGIKNEITIKGQPRNYLYHILDLHENVWGIIPGKFTLGFSIAPEFYRRVYKKNPRKYLEITSLSDFNAGLMSNTVWHDAYNNAL